MTGATQASQKWVGECSSVRDLADLKSPCEPQNRPGKADDCSQKGIWNMAPRAHFFLSFSAQGALVYLAILKWNKLCIPPASCMLIYAFDLVLVTVELILPQGSKVRFPPWISIRPSRGTVGAFMHFTGRLPGGEWSQSECVVCGAFRLIVLIFPMARLNDCWKWRRGSALIIRLRAMSTYFSCNDFHIGPFEFP